MVQEGATPLTHRSSRTARLARAALWSLTAVPIAVSVLASPQWITAHYARGVFPVWEHAAVALSGATSIPITALLLGAAALGAPVVAIRGWRRGRRAGRTRGRLLRAGLARTLGAAALLYSAFLCAWGLGYRQLPIEARWELPAEVGDTELAGFTVELLAILREPPEPADRHLAPALDALRASLAGTIERREGWRPRVPRRVKWLPAGTLLTFGSTGIASPFLLEAHVDGALPEVWRLGVVAHELAHVVGCCGEAEADLAGYAAGFASGDRYVRYAVALRAFVELAGGLPADDWRALRDGLPDVVRADLDDWSRAIRAHRSATAARWSARAYDRYLRSQGVSAGRADYQRALELLLRGWRAGAVALHGTAR
ncbi:MAG: DUF3810 family protein [Planctomycetes bacterium]|nr:DUF3810 family protein [Planctomycetota bacterium]